MRTPLLSRRTPSTASSPRTRGRGSLVAKAGIGLAAGAALVVAVPLAASAHVEAAASSTSAGSETLVTFTIPHGCDGSATTRIAIDVPTVIDAVTPTVNPGWTVKKITSGTGAAARTSRVVYTAKTPLADGYRDTLSLSMTLPVDSAGDTLAFPTLQTCVKGSTDWNEKTPTSGTEPAHPLPAFTVTALDPNDIGDDVSLTPAEEKSLASSSPTALPVASAAPAEGGTDVFARVLGILGLAVGAAGIVTAVGARRRSDR